MVGWPSRRALKIYLKTKQTNIIATRKAESTKTQSGLSLVYNGLSDPNYEGLDSRLLVTHTHQAVQFVTDDVTVIRSH